MALVKLYLGVLLCAPLALAAGIAEVIAQTPELSTLNSILTTDHPDLLAELNATAGTFFAPSNDALNAFISAADPNQLTAEVLKDLVNYHLSPTTLSAADLGQAGGKIAETKLSDPAFANLGGPANVVYASAYGSTGQDAAPGPLKVYSGIGGESTVTNPDIQYDGGLMHVIDRVLDFPQSCTTTMQAKSLTTLLDAVKRTNYADTIDLPAKFTCLAPTNEAIQGAGIDISALSDQQVLDALKYHSIPGEVDYSTVLEDGKEYPTLLGPTVKVHKKDGQLYFNDVAVQQGNIITNNGVAHVLSGVLISPTDAWATTTAVDTATTI
ncbi:FAS1 domain-containing protein [Coprinellus micaceus]|uniref:FAS1 domain-containing protein n=1 Tax=Coprinellus micaceus TaxID=71717 RepID=A0A4Y7SWF0_COPMI|nr:FAS1 domain-containing protein [Coprinellus micaceus]